ncbi:MAG: TonB-dependent receptor [Bacteroidota bacterium]
MKKFTLCIFMLCAFAVATIAQKTVSGTLVDDAGLPLIGANVIEKENPANGTTTDIDGKYTLEVKNNATLIFSYTGYNTQEVKVGSASVYDITLATDSEIIDEILVVGYRNQSKIKSNVAAQVTTAETLENRPNASLVQTLQGQVAGLNITTTSGQPGANSNVRLRGSNSINGNNEPLFVIDGLPVDEDNFRSLNPNEIESITTLKDAGATAIYGNRGANGVIVIKTKKGQFNSGLKVGYSALVGRASRQENDFNLMNAQENLRLEAEFGRGRGSTISEDSISRVVGTDWLDFFFQEPITQQHNLSIQTGGENVKSYTNFGYTDQEGILKESGLQRYSLRNNLDLKSRNDKFRISTSLSLNYTNNDEPNSVGSGAINRNFLLGAYMSVPYISIDEYENGEGLLSPLTFANTPLFLYDRTLTYTRFEEEIRALGSVTASYDILDNLTISSTIGGDLQDQKLTRAEGPTSFNALLFAETGNETPGFQDQQNTRVFSYNWLNSLVYSPSFGDHNLTLGLYTEFFHGDYSTFGFRNEGLDPRTFSPGDGSGFVPDNAANDFFAGSQNANVLEAALFSYFASVDYDYKSKYGIGATIRRDASYRFNNSNRWGTFYSVSGRWNVSEEPFLQDGPFDLLKLRASWGTTGNQRITDSGGFLNFFGGPDLTESFFATGGGYAGQLALSLSQIGNTTLKWETVEQANIGVDFELMKSRLRGSVDYYTKTTNDLFQPRPVSAITSVNSQNANIGSLKNSGIDLALNYDILRSNNGFNLGVFTNLNYNKQEIIDLPTPDGQIINGNLITAEGGQANEYYVTQYVGVNPADGNLQFLDIDGNLTDNPSPDSDRIRTGKSAVPDVFGSFGANMGWKGVYLDLQFNFTSGVYRFDFDYDDIIDPTSIGQFRMSRDLDRAWQNEGDVTDIPSLNLTNQDLDDSSDRFLYDADYVRLRFVRLGYNFPQSILKSIKLDRLNVYLNAENMLTFTNWRGYDPEGTGGASRGYPTPRVISFGLEVGF